MRTHVSTKLFSQILGSVGGCVLGCLLVPSSLTAALASGDLVIADRGPYFNTGTIIQINTNTGTQTVLSTTLKDPYHLDLDAAGDIIVADYENGGPTYGIFKINKTTLAQSTVSTGGSLVVPYAVVVDKSGGVNNGKYIVGDLDANNNGTDEWGAIFVVDPGGASPGNQTMLSSRTNGSGLDFYWQTAVAVDAFGAIFVSDQGDPLNAVTHPPRVFHVDPATGDRTVLTESGSLMQPIGIVVLSDGTSASDPVGAVLGVVDGLAKVVIVVTIPVGFGSPLFVPAVQATVSPLGVSFIYPTHVTSDGVDLIVTDAPPLATAGQRFVYRVLGGATGTGSLTTTQVTSDGFFGEPRGIVLVP
jgi:hypothetical protein